MNQVLCKVCGFDYSHIVGTMHVTENDNGQAQEVVVDNKYTMPTSARYNFRSQGNIHILFVCEDGHYFIKSFDGHKGNVFEDENPLMDGLAKHLTDNYSEKEYTNLSLDYELLGHMENYFRTAE